MKRLLLPLALIGLICINTQAQSLCSQGTKYRNCKACGSATSNKGRRLNLLKNRDAKATHPHKVTIAEIRKPANNSGHFNPSQQVWLVGFVASLDKGGFKETCNCSREDLRDIHINVVADPSERNDKTKYVVVEITPRWQNKFHLNDSDYDAMLASVKSDIEGKWVRFEGWMMSDLYHVEESKNTAAHGTPVCQDNGSDPTPCIWRATTWEVHPVTAYRVVPNP